jgi:hypothetical protein
MHKKRGRWVKRKREKQKRDQRARTTHPDAGISPSAPTCKAVIAAEGQGPNRAIMRNARGRTMIAGSSGQLRARPQIETHVHVIIYNKVLPHS